VSGGGGSRSAVAALAAIGVVTASWWILALWPVPPASPAWLLRTREVCFGSTADDLPTAAGWLLLVGQPIGMLLLLAAVWWRELRAGLARMLAQTAGQLTAGIVLALAVAGIAAVVVRVRTAGVDRFPASTADPAAQLTRVNDAAPALSLTDQHGRVITLASLRGRPAIVTFAFAHCETVCPLIVSDVLSARRRLESPRPEILIVTLDPLRDTPGRLPTIADAWQLDDDAHVLSGEPDDVERALNAWRVPRTRNQRTGDISHPSIVYVVGPDGRITYVVSGGADVIAAAVRAL
jgi:cytochrome oxidase Cu insertion factor (SCO1/SenC/PrrC family)